MRFLFFALIPLLAWSETSHREHFVKLGVPARALDQALELTKGQAQKTHLGIIDYSLSSVQKRFWILNLKNGNHHKIWVAHGVGSGGAMTASRFSNTVDSLQTSLGLYKVGARYRGTFGESFKLHGMQSSNSRAFERKIVLHSAPYVGTAFMKLHNRNGRSHGCLAVAREDWTTIKKRLPSGSFIYSFHDSLMTEALSGLEVGTPTAAEDQTPLLEIERTQQP